VLWRFPALEAAQRVERGAAPPALEPATEEAGGEPAARVRDDVARLGALGEAADARSRRPFGGPASAGAHEAFAEDEAARREGEAPAATSGASAPERRVARAVGTAVHRALECLELEGAEAEARVRAMQEAERALAALLPDAACAGAREELERVLDGMFTIAAQLFGIRVESVPADAPDWPGAWHPDVRYYRVYDRDHVLVGAFYADLFPRDVKRGGAWMNALIVGGPTPDGFTPHVGLIAANASPAVDGGPALLTHDEVETIFH